MSTETKQYIIQTVSDDDGSWYVYELVEGTHEKALERLRNRRAAYPKTDWRISEVVPLVEPAEISGWQVCYKDNEVWIPTSWTYNYGSVEEARQALENRSIDSNLKFAIFKVSGVQEL